MPVFNLPYQAALAPLTAERRIRLSFSASDAERLRISSLSIASSFRRKFFGACCPASAKLDPNLRLRFQSCFLACVRPGATNRRREG
jgi:hypothetical protein